MGINTSRKSGFILRRGVMRRETLWFTGVFASTTLAASTAVLVSTLNAAALALRPFTVVRTRGVLMIESDQEAANERTRAAFGAAVVSDEASAIGVTAIPTPTTDDGSDLWFVYEAMPYSMLASNSSPVFSRVDIDSRAMRKVEDGQDVVTVVEQAAAVGAILTNYVRILIKLH